MKKQYSLTNDTDLTLADVDTSKNVENVEVSGNLRPTQAMQDHFMQNCVDMGILTTA